MKRDSIHIETDALDKEIPHSQIQTNQWYQEDIMRQSACLVVNQITIYSMPSFLRHDGRSNMDSMAAVA